VFPSIVKQMNGKYFFKKDERSNELELGFQLPFEPAGTDSIISSQNYKINNSKKENTNDGKMVSYKMTPQIKSNSRFINASQV